MGTALKQGLPAEFASLGKLIAGVEFGDGVEVAAASHGGDVMLQPEQGAYAGFDYNSHLCNGLEAEKAWFAIGLPLGDIPVFMDCEETGAASEVKFAPGVGEHPPHLAGGKAEQAAFSSALARIACG